MGVSIVSANTDDTNFLFSDYILDTDENGENIAVATIVSNGELQESEVRAVKSNNIEGGLIVTE